jgi:gluconolactonase
MKRLLPSGKIEVIAEIDGSPNGAALGPDGLIYVTNNGGLTWLPDGRPAPFTKPEDYIGGSIQRVDLTTGRLETLFKSCDGVDLCAPNDLVFDRHGGIWFTDLGKRYQTQMDYGALYYIEPGLAKITRVFSGLLPLNGVALSPDESTVYFSETPTARLWSYVIQKPLLGETAKRPKAQCVAGFGGLRFVDSIGVEESGNICVATLLEGSITVVSPSGEIVEVVSTGDKATTNICFGGNDMRTAFITLSGVGHIVKTKWARAGLPLNFLNK